LDGGRWFELLRWSSAVVVGARWVFGDSFLHAVICRGIGGEFLEPLITLDDALERLTERGEYIYVRWRIVRSRAGRQSFPSSASKYSKSKDHMPGITCFFNLKIR
jgi:hypothetical protein